MELMQVSVDGEQTGQPIEVDVEERLPPIQADPIHISSILQELVSNAIKCNRPGGTIRIDATLEVTDDKEQRFVAISVKGGDVSQSRRLIRSVTFRLLAHTVGLC